MPGGLTRLDMIMAGMKEGDSDVYKGDKVLLIKKENGMTYTWVIPREYNGTYTDAQIVKIGLERARALPYVAGSAFRAAPTQISAAYKPIHDLAGVAADGFRRAQLPRVTGLEGSPTVSELIKDAIDGAKIGVGFMPPPPWGTPPPYKDLGSALGWLAGQIWGFFNGRPSAGPWLPVPEMGVTRTGTIGAGGGRLYLYYQYKASRTGDSNHTKCTGPEFSGTFGVMGVANYRDGKPSVSYEWVDGTPCGYVGMRATVSDGLGVVEQFTRSTSGYTPPAVFTGATFEERYEYPIGAAQPAVTPAGPLPSGFVLPEIEPQPEPAETPKPQIPTVPPPAPVVPPPSPDAPPATDPQPPGSPPEREPKAPPATVPSTPTWRPQLPTTPSTSATTRPNGTVTPVQPAPPTTTDPDAHFPFPGSKPITGNGPQATPTEMAKELGRIEEKLARIMSPEADTGIEWKNWIWRILEALFEQTQGRTYTLTEKCPPCDGSDYTPPTVKVTARPGLSGIGTLSSKVDAIAALLDGQLGLKQQVCEPCRPQLTGEWVTVNFLSDEASPSGEKRLRKVFRYRDQTASPLLTHVQHWENFSWKAGPVCVISKNLPWGVPQVWAESAAEGKRVIAHAAQVAGVNLADPKHKWVVSGTDDPRYGQPGTMRVDTRGGRFVRVTKRPGPNGLPSGLSPTP
jgi:hypothetical protein